MAELNLNPRILFLITGLDVGGAEIMLLKLVRGLKEKGCEVHILSLRDNGALESEFYPHVTSLDSLAFTKNPIKILFGLWRLILAVRRIRPQVIHSWMYHADLMTLPIKCLFPRTLIYWCIRNLTLTPEDVSWATRFTARICAVASYVVPRKIITNAFSSRDYHISWGYCSSKFQVIPNGFDSGKFYYDEDAGVKFRESLGFTSSDKLLGVVGRFDPIKGHAFLLRSLEGFLKKNAHVRLLFIGGGNYSEKERLREWVANSHLQEQVHFVEPKREMCSVYNGLDVLISSSKSEGFSNVIGEAIACKCPCIVTDVGDSSYIVGPYAPVVAYGDNVEMAFTVEWILKHLDIFTQVISQHALLRLLRLFSLSQIIDDYYLLYANNVKSLREDVGNGNL